MWQRHCVEVLTQQDCIKFWIELSVDLCSTALEHNFVVLGHQFSQAFFNVLCARNKQPFCSQLIRDIVKDHVFWYNSANKLIKVDYTLWLSFKV